MKMINTKLIIILGIILLFNFIESKKARKNSVHLKKQHIPSQADRNYRKPWPDVSFNPLPQEWQTGPYENYAHHIPPKYAEYNRRLSENNRYFDKTDELAARARSVSEGTGVRQFPQGVTLPTNSKKRRFKKRK